MENNKRPTLGNGKVCYIGMDAPEITARFGDPAGNVIGLYQEPAGVTDN